MTTQPPPESAEPAPIVIKTECWCARCSQQHRFLAFSTVMIVCPNCGNKRCPRAEWHGFACSGSNETGQVGVPAPAATDAQPAPCPACAGDGYTGWSWGSKDTCSECAGTGKRPATPSPAGDDEVTHEQARQALIELVDVEKVEHVSTLQRFLMQQEARQQQAERPAAEGLRLVKELRASAWQAAQRIDEYKASEANWRESLRAAQSVLQGKDEAIAELKARVEEEDARAVEWMDRADELSRKLEATNEDRRIQRVRASDAEIALTEERSRSAELSRKLEAAELLAADYRDGARYETERCDQLLSERNRARNETIAALEKLEAAERELGKLRDAAKRLVYKTPLHNGLPDTADLNAADLDELHNLLSVTPPDQPPQAKPLTHPAANTGERDSPVTT